MASKTTGIRIRHARGCPTTGGARCNCAPAYEAFVFSRRDSKKIRRTFPTLSAAKAWRADATVSLSKGTMRAPTATTIRQAADAWLEGARTGAIRTRSGEIYKPSVLRSYEQCLRLRVLPELGGYKLSELRRPDVQDFADRLLAQGLDASTIRNTLMPLRVVYRRAIARGEVAVNPTMQLELPAVQGKRDRIASPDEATALLAALPDGHRPIWATAFYAGLRLGELRALRWDDIDFDAGVIRIERSWDDKAGDVEPKSKAGRRSVPIVAALRGYLVEHKLRSGRSGGFAFGTAMGTFTPSNVRKRSLVAWRNSELTSIGLHEARHTFASLLIAAGVNVKAISNYMGHSSVTITLDRYGHLMPGHEAEAVEKIDAYLAIST